MSLTPKTSWLFLSQVRKRAIRSLPEFESLQQFGSPDDSWMTPHPETGGPNFASVDEALRACVNRGRGYAPFSALP